MPVKQVKAGQLCTLSVKLSQGAINSLYKTGEIRSGMVLLSGKQIKSTYTCKVDLWTYDGSERSVKNSHKPLLHSAHGSQCCVWMLAEGDVE